MTPTGRGHHILQTLIMKHLIRKIRNWKKIDYKKFISLNDNPDNIAKGFALGAFIGVFPTFWLGGILAIGLSLLLRINPIATLAGSAIIMNPILTPIFWSLSAGLGGLIFSEESKLIFAQVKQGIIFKHLGKIAIIYLTGNIIVSSITAIISYFVIKKMVVIYQNRKSFLK